MPITLSAETLEEWLTARDLTDANAARIFDVTPQTVAAWRQHGISRGPAAVLARFLLDQKIPPLFVAQRLGIKTTVSYRHQYPQTGKTSYVEDDP